MTDSNPATGNDEPDYGSKPTEYEMKRQELGPRQGYAPPREYDPRAEYSDGRSPLIENALAGWPLEAPASDATTFAAGPPADLGIDALLGPTGPEQPAVAEPPAVADAAAEVASPAAGAEIADPARAFAGPADEPAAQAQAFAGPTGEPAQQAQAFAGPTGEPAQQAQAFAGPTGEPAGQASELAGAEQQFAGSAAAFGAEPAVEPAAAPIPGRDPIITPVGSGPEPRQGGTQVPPSAEDSIRPQHPKWRHLYHLSMDSRMRIWRRRALITVVAGVVFTIIFTWRLGLTIAVIVAIGDTVYRSRTMASIPPGIRLSRAQRRTQRQLTRLERAGYRSLHSRRIPSSEDFIDHLVVGPSGMYAIDSEKWDHRLPIRTRNARQLWHGPHSKKDRLEHAHWEAEQAGELITAAVGTPITVRPAMAVYGPRVPWDIATIREVDVFRGGRLRKYFRKRARAATMPLLTEEEVERIHRAAMVALPLADGSGS